MGEVSSFHKTVILYFPIQGFETHSVELAAMKDLLTVINEKRHLMFIPCAISAFIYILRLIMAVRCTFFKLYTAKYRVEDNNQINNFLSIIIMDDYTLIKDFKVLLHSYTYI